MTAAKACASLAHVLAALQVGEPLYFVLLAGVAPGYPPLLVQSAVKDPDGDRVLALATKIEGATPPFVHGDGFVDDDGVVTLRSPDLDRAWLEQLAAWVRGAAEAEPRLGVLAGARMQVTEGAAVVRTYDLPQAWIGVRAMRPRRKGSQQDHAAALWSLPRGASARFWLSATGAPLLIVSPRADDADGSAFTDAVSRARMRGVDPDGEAHRGLVQRDEGGRLAFIGQRPPAALAPALARTARSLGPAHPALWELLGARALQIAPEGFGVGPQVVEPPDLSALRKALSRLSGTSTAARAWFSPVSADGTPRLVLAPSPDKLKAAASPHRGAGPELVGTVQFSPSAPPTLQARRAPADTLAHLAGFAAAWVHDAPELATLRGAGDGSPPPAGLWGPLESPDA